MAKCLWKSSRDKTPLVSFSEHNVIWKPYARIKVDPDLPRGPIQGRLIYLRVEQNGFRPMDVYLFTTLLDDVFYPLIDICDLYSQRWQVELDLRQVKTTLEMEQFEVKSVEMFKKELIAGLLTYNIILSFMLQAAIKADIQVCRLSFNRCWRRIRNALLKGVPAWVKKRGDVVDYLLDQLAKCILPNQKNKVKHEPRKVRRKPAVYPQLRGRRENARKEVLQALAA